MSCVHGFPPITIRSATILVLGTAPGKVSLRAEQYYAHPRNTFWKIVAELFQFDPTLPYHARVERLRLNGIAVWDVLQLCTRESSLDSDIDSDSVVPNDFVSFFKDHPGLHRVCFNGAKAEALYISHVQPHLGSTCEDMEYVRLPSTSPANAGVPYNEKLRAWAAALEK